jgi:outer membrane protein assembly factor BamB
MRVMKRQRSIALTIVCALGVAAPAFAQGRGGAAWSTTGGDAERTASVRNDPRITPQRVAKTFQLLWKRTLEDPSKRPNALTQPVLLPNIISYKGFKALAFVGGAADNVYAIDYDLSRMFWQRHLGTASQAAGSDACPGLTTITRPTPIVPSGSGGRGGGRRGQPPPPAAAAGGGRAAPPAPPMPGTGPGANAVLGGVGARGGNDNVYAIASDGKLYALNPQDGTDMVPPIPFLPARAKATGSILIDTVLYAATTSKCGGAPNAVWAIELANDAYTVTKWESKDAIVGDGPAFGADATIYVASGNDLSTLAPKTLAAGPVSSGSLPFTSSPAVFSVRGKNVVVAGRKGVLASMVHDGDHLINVETPLPKPEAGSGKRETGDISGVATSDEGNGRMVFASVTGTTSAVVAFKLIDAPAGITLQPAWTSRELTAPTTPLLINGVVFALSGGEARPAVLYALDAATGKELWNSGSLITSPVRGVAPSGGDGQVYVATSDGTLYAFGIPVER